ncbi:MAG: hypothetical protein V4472_24555 [Pseudomonadota bacterium]
MSFRGGAVIASWSEPRTADLEDLRAWHTHEHIPERLSLPGFLRARRYHGTDGPNAWFILYEVASLDVLASPAYLTRLNDPTPWTRASVPRLHDAVRGACRVVHSTSFGVPGIAGTLRIPEAPPELRDRLDSALQELARRKRTSGITGFHICQADRSTSTIATVERSLRAPATPSCIVIVEGLTKDDVTREVQQIRPALPNDPGIAQFWQCELIVDGDRLQEAWPSN